MAYTKQNWRRLKSELIPVEPENLEQIEDGIVELESRIQAGLGEIETTTTTTKADYSIEKPTEDFKVLEKVPFEEGVTYEAVVTVDEVEYSYSVQLVDGASLDFDYYDLTGFKVLTCGTLLGTDAKGLMIIQDCIASLSPLNATKTDGYTSVYTTFDKVVIKDVYVNTETTHKIKNQDEKYTKAFQADALCTDEKDVSFIKNNPIQKELVKAKKYGYKLAFDATDFELILGEDDLIKVGYVKDTALNSKINFAIDPLTVTVSNSEDESETFEVFAVPGDEFGLPKNAIAYFFEAFDYPLIIQGLTKIDPENNEFIGAVGADGTPLYDEDGELVADDESLFVLAHYYPESIRTILTPEMIINETLAEDVEEEHFNLSSQFVEDFQADFAEGDSTKAGFIKNMPFYSVLKSLPGFTIDESLSIGDDFKLCTGTTKSSLLLEKESNYEVALFEVYQNGTIDGECLNGFYPGIVYNRAEMLEAMQADNFAYKMSETEISSLDSILPADCSMLAIDDGSLIIPVIFTHIHMSITDTGALQVVTDENADENYFTYICINDDTVINITGKNIPENNYKIRHIKKLPSEFIDNKTGISVTNYLDPYDDKKAVSGYGIWQYLNDRVRAQVLSTSDGHINFVKADDGSRSIDFSVETIGIGYNEDLKTTEKDTIVGAINELVSNINENKLQVADSGINNIYYTDKNGKPQEQLIKQNYVTAVDKHTCYEALLNDTNIYWCPPYTGDNYIYGFSTETFNVYALNTSTKTVTKAAVVKDMEIKDTLTQAFASSSIICVNLHTSSTTEKWVFKSSISSSLDRTFTEPVGSTTYFEIYMQNKQHISIGFSKGIIKSATVTDMSEVLTDLPSTLRTTGNSIFGSSSTTGSTRTQIRTGKKYTVTTYYSNTYRRHILTQGPVMGGTPNTGVNYMLYWTTSKPMTYGDSANSDLQLIIAGDNSRELVAQRSLNPEGVEIYSYDGTDYTGIDNNTHSQYIYLTAPGVSGTNPFCLTSAGECIWRNATTGNILARKTIQTNSSDLFAADTLRTAKLYYSTENSLLYVVNSSSIYAINISDENPIATVVKAQSTDDFTFNDNCRLIGFGENFVLLTNGSTLKIVQIRESFNCNELKLGDTAQDKIVLKDSETGNLYNLVIKNGQVVIEAVTV